MTKEPQVCVYCNERPANTRDHVIPKGIFLPPRPSNLITVPCCKPCNSDKQEYDDLLRDFLSIDDFTNQNADSLELYLGPTRRAIDKNRSRLAQRVLEMGTIVEVRTPDGDLLDWRYALQIDLADFQPLFEYIARGLSFDQYGVRLPKDVVIEVSHLARESFTTIIREMNASGHSKGPTRIGQDNCVFMSLFLHEYHCIWAISFFQDRWFTIGISHPDGESASDRHLLEQNTSASSGL